jgi:hypothetical protein
LCNANNRNLLLGCGTARRGTFQHVPLATP